MNPTIALGFFNFSRYRLWLDLDPNQWPVGQAPEDHPIVGAVLNGDPLPQKDGNPTDDDVANHQATDDLPIVMDADSTQYATLLAGQKGVSLVIQGPPGSGKSQTITNLIAVSIAQGKRVLFVAQKLPALQVVRRRLETVELAPFCLPLFSDKARVTEVHKHLASSARLRENRDWQRPLNNQVVALAKKLNNHAARLRVQPAGFNHSAFALIQRATALHLMLREAWGTEWNDELLEITVQEVESSPEWLEKREQTIHQWHRLKGEVGTSWSNWTPLNLGAMDTQTVEAFSRAGRAMQDLCPCWMMTPLAVAQFLAPEAISFDVVIMDEASQINPEDAWGAITRGRQLVIVGDQKQMPPSDFFMSALEDDESPEQDEEIDGGKSESILDASISSLLSSSLLWHYRSRHETLIAPANSFSYQNRLVLFPHPHRSHPELGIRYNRVSDATTTTGKVVNALEAMAVATRVRELVLRESAKLPKDRLTIGVVTMNLYQQDAIMDLLGNMRESDRHFDSAMTTLSSEQNEEPLFVRNLENIQGDERDIMILSCTYGPHTPGGTPAQRFGPLNRQGGERRFNVLITRAKWRMEIFSSIGSDQIVVDGKQQGIRDFHLFLKYAESGVLADPGETTDKPADSPFETQVEAVLQRAGFQTQRQVGVAGYYIDLAIKHPHHQGLFALGVECDGKTYHSSRAARDRDRLREKVLLERGWHLHRIWSTDWFVNPIQAKKKLLDAVKAACQ